MPDEEAGVLARGPGGAWPRIAPETLGRLMPMALWVGPEERIRMVGPTLAKLIGAGAEGMPFEAHFQSRRTRSARRGERLGDLLGQRLHVVPHRAPGTILRGIAVPLAGEGGVLLNLTFGVGLSEAVRLHGLTEADFAPSDLAMELLYLQEAKAVVTGQLRGLNARLESARQTAEREAQTDPLTGLANRRALDMALNRAVMFAEDHGTPFALMHLDLDHFKEVNDSLGHGAGDHVLTCVAEILREEIRRVDVAARVGGDEFLLLMRGRADADDLQSLGERIIARIEEPISFDGNICAISASIGITLSTSYDPLLTERMLADADAALYASKRRGRARCTVLLPGGRIGENMRL